MEINLLQYALWVLPAAIQVCILAAMLRRKLRSEYPYFFAYTAFQVVNTALLLVVYHISYMSYFVAYWVGGFMSVVLGFAVIREIFAHAFRPYAGLHDMGSAMFRWTALVLVLVSGVIAIVANSGYSSSLMALIITFERSVRLMQVGLLLFLFLFAERLKLSWRDPIFGLALGFGIVAGVDLALVTLMAQFGIENSTILNMIKSATYGCAAIMWLGYMLAPQPERRPVELVPQMEKFKYAYAVPEPYPHDGFVSTVERTVDRVLSRTDAMRNITPPL